MQPHGRRLEDRPLLTTGGTYVADVRDPLLDGAAWLHFVRSDVAHAEVVGIDASAALDHGGVLGVFTADDLDVGPMPPVLPRFPPDLSPALLAEGCVRHVGEPIAAVVAETPAIAVDAAELARVETRARPVVVDVASSLHGDVLVGRTGESNVVASLTAGRGDPGTMFDACDVVVRLEMQHARVSAAPLEPRGAASVWRDGRLHHWLSTQGPHSVRRALAAVFGIDEQSIRVVAPDVGGGFGPKFWNSPEDVVVAWAARRLGRPVRWIESRSESMVGLHHGRGRRQVATIGGTRDGRITTYRLEVLQDSGAYASLGAYAPDATVRMTTGVYDIASAHASAVAVATNATPVSAHRGTGRPEATCAIERAVDRFAAVLGLDPVEVRVRNVVPSSSMPYETAVGTVYDSGDYLDAMQRAVALAGVDELRREQAARRARGDRRHLGIGLSCYVESTAAGPAMEFATVSIDRDGGAVVRSGSSPHGQGHVTAWTALVGSRLGIPPDRVRVHVGDTDLVPVGLGTFASRSTQLAGSAIVLAAEQIVERSKATASQLLEASVDDVVFDAEAGAFSVRGAPARSIGWSAVARATDGGVVGEDAMFAGAMTFPFGCHVAVVEVDEETGGVRLLRHVAVDDAGVLLNPTIAEGQVHGGIAHAVGEALYEAIAYDDAGTPLTTNLADYAVPSAAELPFFETYLTETPAPSNPLGAKGIGESGTIGGVAAIQNAVCDALAPLGVEHVDLPMTPERVWRAIVGARRA
jgi:carbon-monoxide dehydrogenase large subunit